MLVGALPQASAGVLSWGYASLPGGYLGPTNAANPGSICTPGFADGPWASLFEVNDYAVAGDGMTIYAATTYGGYVSHDQGRTWSSLLTAFAGITYTDRVAVAPDDPNTVAFLNTHAGTPQFGVSKSGGFYTTLHVSAVTDAAGDNADAVLDIDIAPQTVIHGDLVRLVLVAGTTATGPGLFYLNYGVEFADWDECLTSTYTEWASGFTSTVSRWVTVKASPAFARDYVAYLVGDNGDDVIMNVVSFNSNQFDADIPSYQYYDNDGFTVQAAIDADIDRAEIVFDPAFVAGDETSRYTYIAVSYENDYTNTGDLHGGVYQITDQGSGPLSLYGNIGPLSLDGKASVWSIDLNADGTILVAADGKASFTWTMKNPKSIPFTSWAASRTVKRSGGGNLEGFSTATDKQTIAYAGDNVVLARCSTQGAFSLSRDNGYTFNDINFVAAFLDYIDDTVISPDGTQRYVASWDINDGAESIFYWDGTYWERVLTIETDSTYVIGASPSNFSVLYVANKSTALLRYTATNGRANWLERTSPIVVTGLADLCVQNDTTLWVATNVGDNGCVTKLTETGNIWPVGPPYYNAIFTWGFLTEKIASLTLIADDTLVAGGQDGHVAYSAGGAFWTVIGPTVGTTSNVHATATGLGSGSMVFAVSEGSDAIVRWTIGSSIAWTAVDNVGGTNQYCQDIQIYNGAMYVVSTNGTVSYLGRALPPYLGWPFPGEWAFNTILYTPSNPDTNAVANIGPNVLKFSADPEVGFGNKIWIIDASGAGAVPSFLDGYKYGDTYTHHQIMVYTDVLVSGTVTLYAPKDGALVQVNRETGIAYNTTLSWKAASSVYFYEQYELMIGYDADFTRILCDEYPIVTLLPISSVVIGPLGGTDVIEVNYQPGETYYWKVRVISPWYSPWSETWTINVQPIRMPIPELYSPANGGTVQYLRPGFSWTPMGAYVQMYHIQIATSHTFSADSIVVDEQVDASTVDGAGYGLSKDLVDGKQYFWHVQVIEPFEGDWSTVANFWVGIPKPPTTQVVTVPGATTYVQTYTQPAATSLTVTAPVSQEVVNPSYIWAIIIIGAVLVIAVIVLIFRTRRV
jgi:hypothetical protein